MKRFLLLLTVVAVVATACQDRETMSDNFVKVDNGRFVRDGKPYYYVGTNFWYGAILGSEGQGGDRERLARELDEMRRIGIDNLRILVGSDGERGCYPRDGFKFDLNTPTNGRDGYYKYVFSLVADNAETGGKFAGCNFWGWGGFAKPLHVQWQVGDPYTNAPAQEAQGLNSVFVSDTTTLNVVKAQVERMKKVILF